MAIELLKGDRAATETRPGKHNDGGGLYLDVRSATSASYVFKFTFGGKVDELGLGSRKKVTIERARELRAICANELANFRNPKDLFRQTKLELVRAANAAKPATVYEIARDNIAEIAKGLKSAKGRTAWVRSLHRDFIGGIADMNPELVTVEDVKACLTPIYTGRDLNGKEVRKAAPVLAQDIRQRLAKVLSWSRADGRIKVAGWENPARWDDNLEHTLKRGEHVKESHASLPAAKVGQFIADLRKRDATTPAMRLALEWHVISATRPGEAAALDWAWFDWANECVNYPPEVMKMRRLHRVPLTARHHEIVTALIGSGEPPESGPVFAVYKGDSVSVTGLRRVMQTIQPEGCSLHGFRATFATWARAETYPVILPDGSTRRVRLYDEAMIEECLAHVVGNSVRNDYVRDDFLELRRAIMESWASYCGKVLETNVLPMRRRLAA